MKDFEVEGPDGSVYKVNAREGTPPADLIRMAQDQRNAQPKPATTRDRLVASVPGRYVKGLKDPIDAGAQLLTHMLPDSVVDAGNSFNNWLADKTGLVTKLPERKLSSLVTGQTGGLDQALQEDEAAYQAARWNTGQRGFDGARTAGNIVNPVNVAMAMRLPAAATTAAGRAITGAISGAAGGLTQPVTDAPSAEDPLGFAARKSGQVLSGAAGGAVLGPVLGKVFDVVAPRIKALQAHLTDPEVLGARASLETDQAIRRVFVDMGIDQQSIPEQVLAKLRSDVLASFKQGQRLDAAAALRKMDFDTQKVPALRGQITRDPAQYSRDLNLRGVEGVGEPIQGVLTGQNQKITQDLAKFGGTQAAEKYQAGDAITQSLSRFDNDASAAVSRAYKNARASSGKDWEVPLGGLSSDVQSVVDNFGVGGEKNAIPSAIYARLQSLGVVGDGMTQRKVFNYEEADKLLKQINAHMQGGGNGSLSALHGAVKRAILDGGGDGDPFGPARKLAAERFQLLDAVPALKAVVDGRVAPDDFVDRFIINGKVKELQRLAKIMPADDLAEAKKQIARVIYEGAFKGNAAGDKAASPLGLQSAMRKIGTDKLKVFFSEPEIEELNRLTRITAYATTEPAWGTVARGGNPGGVLFGGLARLGGAGTAVGKTLPMIGAGLDAGSKSFRASAAMNTQVPKTANLTPEEVRMMSGLLGGANVAAGGLLAP